MTAPYVTRAGQKLAAGLMSFDVSPSGMTCLDIGCAGGGFTDCLLRHGAARVYAVDVAYGIFDWRLRHDGRVVLLERTNARYLDEGMVPEAVDLVTCDVSFISLAKIMPAARKFMKPDARFIILYKPQFELPRKQLGRHGIPRDGSSVAAGIAAMTAALAAHGLRVLASAPSPILGRKGNAEYLLHGGVMAE